MYIWYFYYKENKKMKSNYKILFCYILILIFVFEPSGMLLLDITSPHGFTVGFFCNSSHVFEFWENELLLEMEKWTLQWLDEYVYKIISYYSYKLLLYGRLVVFIFLYSYNLLVAESVKNVVWGGGHLHPETVGENVQQPGTVCNVLTVQSPSLRVLCTEILYVMNWFYISYDQKIRDTKMKKKYFEIVIKPKVQLTVVMYWLYDHNPRSYVQKISIWCTIFAFYMVQIMSLKI